MKRYLMLPALAFLLLFVSACEPEVATRPDTAIPDASDVALNNRGVALMGYFDYASARDVFRQVVDRKPGWLDAKVNLAIATLNRQLDGDEQLALGYLHEVIATDPLHLRAHFVLGLLQERNGETEKAIAHYKIVREHDPNDAYAAYYLAVLTQSTDPQQALELFREAVRLDPYLRSAYYGAFLLLLRSGDREAGMAMKEAYERLANNPRAKLAETKYTRMGEKASALALNVPQPAADPLPEGDLFGAAQVISKFSDQQQRSLTTVDVQGDGVQDIFVANSDGKHQLVIAADVEYQITDKYLQELPRQLHAVAWGDLDNDGATDAVACFAGGEKLGLWKGAGNSVLIADAGLNKLSQGRRCTDVMLLDADHDGDLDVFVAFAAKGHDVLSNNGDGSWRSLARDGILPFGQQRGLGLVAGDLDRDRDADLIVINDGGDNDVLFNDRLWKYQKNPAAQALEKTALVAGVVADVDADGRQEVYALTANGKLQRFLQNGSGNWIANELMEVTPGANAQIGSVDFNGDGHPDLLVVDNDAVQVIDVSTEQPRPLFRHAADVVSAIPVLADSDLGPSLFALINQDDGQQLMHWPPGPGRGHFIGLSFTGKENAADSMRSNRSGIGTAVAARRGSQWTISSTFDANSGRGQSLQPLAIGLAGQTQLDYIAIDWSDGVFQTELDLPAGQTHTIAETQRQLSSCPVLFAWNGEEWTFVSDILGVGGIGFMVQPGKYSEPRPWEHFLFPEEVVQPLDDRVQIKITEPMEEIALIDGATLTAFDLAPGWHMTLDERMWTGGPMVTGKPLFYRHAVRPARGWRDDGLDVTAAVQEVDHNAAEPGNLHPRYLGRLDRQRAVTLEFDEPLDTYNKHGHNNPVLLADGWVEYPYSQTVFAAWQADETYFAPTLEAAGADGQWHTVYTSFGYPAGMPRQMSVPLEGLPQ
ncbi:MAG: tetratricopeptide repeat protein, partial [Gammaproteobacteria bacterium]|nr:tetratricopeptide repeat protein [Gammaproteobacteria bacterium]